MNQIKNLKLKGHQWPNGSDKDRSRLAIEDAE